MADEFRLSYSQRDYAALEDEVSRYIKAHFPEINIIGEGTEARSFVRLLQGMVDTLGMSLDVTAVESRLSTAKQPRNAALAAEVLAYFGDGPTPAQTDVQFTLLDGVAPIGGSPIAKGSRVTRLTSPALDFVTLEDAQVPEGQASVLVPVAEGAQVVEEPLTFSFTATSKSPKFKLTNKRVWKSSIEVIVGGEVWIQLPMSQLSLGPNYPSYRVLQDPITLETFIWFPFTGPWAGRPIPPGVQVRCSYIRHNGTTGNTAAGKVTKLGGTLASLFTATNPEAATGGSDGEDPDTIRSKAPHYYGGSNVAITEEQIKGLAKSVGGVQNVRISEVNGFFLSLQVLPIGGGVASKALLDAVKLRTSSQSFPGVEITPKADYPAFIVMTLNVFLKDTMLKRETAKLKVRTGIEDALKPENAIEGRGFAISDISDIVEDADPAHIDYVDVVRLSRIPRVTKSNVALPDTSEVSITTSVKVATWIISTLTATTFQVSRNGVIDSFTGTIGTEFTVESGEVKFTVGKAGETFPSPYGDTYRFSTSSYAGNLRIDADEFQQLRQASDLIINVYYPTETPA